MPIYTLNRDHILRSTSGVISFCKDEEVFVPTHMESEVVAIGGCRVDGSAPHPLGDEVVPEPQITTTDRATQIVSAFDLLSEKNDPNEFTAQGIPTVKAVEKIVGFDVARDEVSKAWGEYRLNKGE